jgi:hypothetical protein
LIPTDCEALAYQAAVLSETARVADLTFLRFLDWAWRPVVLDFLTQTPSALPPMQAVFPGFSGGGPPLFWHARQGLVKGPHAWLMVATYGWVYRI